MTRRGRILQASDGCVAQVVDEIGGQHVSLSRSTSLAMNSLQVQLVNVNDITISGVQAAVLPKTEHRRTWEGRRVMITRGSLKGYRGLVKTEDPNGIGVELDAKLASHGLAMQRFHYGEFKPECATCHL
jgi:transcription elongation factor